MTIKKRDDEVLGSGVAYKGAIDTSRTYGIGSADGYALYQRALNSSTPVTMSDGTQLLKDADGTVYAWQNGQRLGTQVNYTPPAATAYDVMDYKLPRSTFDAEDYEPPEYVAPAATYDPAAYVAQALEAIKGAYTPPEAYVSPYGEKVDALLEGLLNRGEFSYSLEDDPLYQQYRAQYERNAARAVQDTMGSFAGMTGGLPSSWATTAGAMAGQNELARLNEVAPQLYDQAYGRYRDDYNAQLANLGAVQGLDRDQYQQWYDRQNAGAAEQERLYRLYVDAVNQSNYRGEVDYARSRDALADSWRNTEWNYGLSRDALADSRYSTEWNYGLSRDALSDSRYNTEWNYGVSRDALSDERYNTEWNYGVGRDALSDERYNREWDYGVGRDALEDERYNQEWDYGVSRDLLNDSRSAGSGGGGSGGGSGSGLTSAQAYSRVMDSLEMEVMPTPDMIAAAGLSEDWVRRMLGLEDGGAAAGARGPAEYENRGSEEYLYDAFVAQVSERIKRGDIEGAGDLIIDALNGNGRETIKITEAQARRLFEFYGL